MKTCKKCGNEFEPSKGLVSYCSLKCRNSRTFSEEAKLKKSKANKGKRRTEYISLTCEFCDTKFEVPICKKEKKFCSFTCKQRGLGRRGGLKSSTSQNKRSKNEIYFSELCKTEFDVILTNISMFNGWDADIIIPEKKIAILWNGIWHYKKITKNHSVKQVQTRDRIKLKEISNFGYISYIIKDLGRYNKEFVEQEFIKFKQYIAE
jgi:hypothetical protein